ncbi:amino acid ABC transporter substrate-binding protein [Chelatococcus reniformis]|uniref:Amino acid ABC transporter substrate-binding protein n=1 Tax=Chelatococcus reniformis TaxID=1494448 RepID=A0A916XG84_9HYPH|nr:amino acid ABC transporter substrate-binding protein [Chelatococcus reniformis]GGC71236.1 amino acid ABC transporter substrate-binding protein [Chelatococcus reniformis]
MKRLLASLALTTTLLAAGAATAGTLDQVKQRGQVVCGSNPSLAGFGVPDDKGQWVGFDVDYCRAVAAAIFNDPTKVKFVPLSAKDRFTALQTGEIDLLVRNSTWTMSRDTALGVSFTATNFYDGQAFMVRKKLGVSSALELNGATVCVQQGTTTELNLADFFRSNKMKYEIVSFATNAETVRAYDSGRCDAFTTDTSALYAERLRLTNPDEHVILPEIISKEPFAPVVRKGDEQWFDLVRWVGFALVGAEELGVAQTNVDEMTKSESPEIRRLLGVESKFGEGIGLGNDWVVRIIKAVGNYGEIFDRNLGDGSRLKIKRGMNALWSKGGVQYSPPIR